MNWFAWRQNRKSFITVGIFFVLFAILLISSGIYFWNTYQHTLAACAQNPATPGCDDLASSLFQTTIDQTLLRQIPKIVLIAPLLLGMFWGAPLLAREYSEGTGSLVWTQGISRRKWLTVKVAWILVATTVVIGAMTLLNMWWARTTNTLYQSQFSTGFSSQDIVPIACGLFAVAIGILFGAWFKKTMIAIAVTLFAFTAVALVLVPNFIRPHYMTPITVMAPIGPGGLDKKIPGNAWTVVSANLVNQNGKAVNFDITDFPTKCQQIMRESAHSNAPAAVKDAGRVSLADCLNNAGFRQMAKYQPFDRYWIFQGIETAIYLCLAILAISATYWLVLKRDA